MSEHIAGDAATAKALAKTRGDGKKVGLDEFKQLVRARAGVAK